MEFSQSAPGVVGGNGVAAAGMSQGSIDEPEFPTSLAGVTALALAPPDGPESDSIEVLYDRYAGVIFSLALRIVQDRQLAEEILEEVFFRAWQQSQKQRSMRGTILAWLTEMTRAMAIEAVFDRPAGGPVKVNPSIGLDSLHLLADPRIRESQRAVKSALDALPAEQRQAIELAYFEGQTEDEIAESLGVQRETVRTWLSDAIRVIGAYRHSS
jgi:RNA polymerase sigma-70 factor (ECF subfamily)